MTQSDKNIPVKDTESLNRFGRMLRFWRTTFEMSQEELSFEVEVSTKHISFLESGRSQPGRAMVAKFSEAFDLGLRDTNNLLLAAGFLPPHEDLFQDALEFKWLRQSLIVTMERTDPYPAHVMDPYGNIVMLNKAWLRLFRNNSMPGFLNGPINIYHLYFSEMSVRFYRANWERLACNLLMNLQQEVLLYGDPASQKILDELLKYPHIPDNWQRRAADFPQTHNYNIRLQLKDDSERTYLLTNNTVGSTHYASEPRLLLTVYYPQDQAPYSSMDELENDPSLQHPLLFY